MEPPQEIFLQAPVQPSCDFSFAECSLLQQSAFSAFEETSFLQHAFSVLVPHAKALPGIIKKPNITNNTMQNFFDIDYDLRNKGIEFPTAADLLTPNYLLKQQITCLLPKFHSL